MVYLLEIAICTSILLIGGLTYIFTKYFDVRFEDGEDY